VRYANTAARSASGLRATRVYEQPVAAVHTRQADAATFWRSVVTGDATLAPGVDRIWLDFPVASSWPGPPRRRCA
jgi:hypothetical protein